MSNNKRVQYEYELSTSESESESYGDTNYIPNDKNDFPIKRGGVRSGRKPKCFTKNALLARENRLKKKIYLTNLENDVTTLRIDNKKLSAVVDNQSYLISDLKKQVKYLKSVIANSSDISKLIRNIHQNTGMSVSSSLDKKLSLKNVCVPKPNVPIARKTAHPWEETNYPSYPTPESCFSSPEVLKDDEFTEILNNIPLDFPIDIPEDQLMESFDFKEGLIKNETVDVLDEHDYTTTPKDVPESDEDVGVCLHVSKHRVSLEFCTSCSENAAQSWLN